MAGAVAELRYASFARRAAAAAIDLPLAALASMALLIPANVIVALAASTGMDERSRGILLRVLTWAAIVTGTWLYFALSESGGWQATYGKFVAGIRVSDVEGRRIGFMRASRRHFAKYLTALSVIPETYNVLFHARHQAWHDRWAQTVVVEDRADEKARKSEA